MMNNKIPVQKQMVQEVEDWIVQHDYEVLYLLSLQDDIMHCIRYAGTIYNEKDGTEDTFSTFMTDFVQEYVVDEDKDEMCRSLDLEYLRKKLEKRNSVEFAFSIKNGEKIRRKRWKFEKYKNDSNLVLFTGADVTEAFEEQERQRNYLRDALVQAEQASFAKSDFLSRMSHEIRTPMNAIIGMSALAAQCVDDPERVSDCISKVGISARFLLSLINDILDMSRIESGKMTVKKEKFPFEDLVNGINTIIYEQAEASGLDYECIMMSFTDDYYIGDAMKIQQVLINILGNAVKFTSPGGKVQFMVNQSKVENGQAHMKFTINDTGIGISDTSLKTIFEPFEQGHGNTTGVYSGTGLGLAICKNLIHMMNGKISVNSIEGVGSEFVVELPLELCEDEKKYPKQKPKVTFDKLKALVVDDDVIVCEHTQDILSDMGMQAEWVDSGRKAVDLVKEKWSKKHYYDVILLDWKMPDMSGIETAKEIRKIVGPDVTISIMTAYDWSAIEKEAKLAGVNMLISKPLFISSLTSTFEKIYGEKEQQDIERREIEYDFSQYRVLLVEDHLLNVEVAKRLLESKGAKVEVAENGLAAIENFATVSGDYYDAILMDIRMPIMDGLTAARSIRQMKNPCAKTIPIIAMSANAFDEDVEKSKSAGMNAHLAKPIEPDRLYQTLYDFVEEKKQA